MNDTLKYLALTLVLLLIILTAGAILVKNSSTDFTFSEYFLLSFSMASIAAAVILIFMRGQHREAKEEVMFTFTAIGLKFILELFLAMAWFLIAKKSSIQCVILFFVLYLTFSIFTVVCILKRLKKKSL